MFKALAFGASLSLISLNAMALPGTVDISGIELGASIEKAAAELKERYPDATIKEKDWPDHMGKGLGYFHIKNKDGSDLWELQSLPDGTGRVVKIERTQRFKDKNVGMEATREALHKKYGQESGGGPGSVSEDYYWANKTDDAPADFKIDDAEKAYRGASQIFSGRFNPADSENIKAVVKARLDDKYQEEALVDKLDVYAIWVEPALELTLNHIKEQKQKEEAERQRKLKAAENNAADL